MCLPPPSLTTPPPALFAVLQVQAQSAEEIMELLQRGNRNRTQHPTAANEVSSRSHAVLQVRM